MESFLKSSERDDITAVYAHNDDMALGAIQAIEAAGKKPGEDILIVSVDGVKAALQAIVEGKLNCSVECNAMLGPQLFDLIEQVLAGKKVPKRVLIKETVFDKTNAKEALPHRPY
jgi:ABC-type sugar transport system substrate-binding protein